MKKVFLVIGALLVILIGALLVIPFVVPVETFARQLEAQVERATGRALTIAGPVELSVLPTLTVEAENVRFANVPGGAEADMAQLKALRAQLKIWPLLRGAVEVDRFILVQPVIHLEVDEQGRANWQFGAAGEAAEDEGAAEGDGGATLPVTDLRLGDIRIEGGVLTFRDAASGTTERLEAVDLSLRLPDIRSPFEAEGSLRYKGQPVALDLRVETPLALVQNGASQVRLAASAPQTELAFEGQVNAGAAPRVDGGVELRVAALREVVAWLGEPLAIEGEGLQTLHIDGRLEAVPERVAFTDATIELDTMDAAGEVVVSLAGQVPKVGGRLDLGVVDLTPYLSPAAVEPVPDPEPAGETGAPPDWSDEPIALPPLGGFELDFRLAAKGLKLRDLELGPSALNLTLQGDTFAADLTDFALYGGRGSGRLQVTLADGVPQLRKQFRLQGLQALPFLQAAAGFERLEGTADAEIDFETRGRTERELVQNLNGSGSTIFRDGAIVGINLAAMIRNVGAAFLDPAAAETRKTDFAELAGSFTIRDGVLRNDDMRLQAPVLRVTGQGRIDLPARTLQYRIEPRAVASIEGQGGREQASGILVPVVIEGPWHDLKFRPDLSGVVESALRDPAALREQVEQQIEQLGDQGRVLEEALEQATSREERQRLLEELQKPGGAEALVEQLQQGEGPKSLLEGLTGAISGQRTPRATEGAAPPADQEGQPQEPARQEQPAQDPAQRLLKGLFGN